MLSLAPLLIVAALGQDPGMLVPEQNQVVSTLSIARTKPQDDYPVIVDYLNTLPVESWQYMRFLSLYNIPPQRRSHVALTTSLLLNGLSWSHALMTPMYVPGSNDRIMIFDVRNYCRNDSDVKRWLDTWELLTFADRYYLEPWVPATLAKQLTSMTGSVGAILRADFFCFYASLEDKNETKDVIEGFYSRFLGLPSDEAALFKLLAISQETIKTFGTGRRAGVIESGNDSDAIAVTFNNRFVNRFPTTTSPHGGYLWVTQDFANSVDKRNILNDILNNDKDGGEYIFSLPNRLQGYFLTQKVKKNDKVVFQRIHAVPIDLATDNNFPDRQVKIRSCTVCHVMGINTFKDVVFGRLLSPTPPGGVVQLQDAKPPHGQFKLHEANQLFYPDLLSFALADQQNYSIAVEQLTGVKPQQIVQYYKETLLAYENTVSPEQALWEFGVQGNYPSINDAIADFLADKVVSTTRGSLLDLVKGGHVKRDTFEEEFQNGMLLQEIKSNIVRKGDAKFKIALEVPGTTVIGTAHNFTIPLDSQWKVFDGRREYGPINDDTLGRWLLEKRIRANFTVMQLDVASPQWVEARELFPQVFPNAFQWRVRAANRIYGPVSGERLEEWFGEGRIKSGTELMRGDEKVWRPAQEVFPDKFQE